MNKITKTLLSILTIAFIVGLAFYPKIKKTFFSAETKEKGKEKSGPGGKGGKTAVIVTVVKSTRLDDYLMKKLKFVLKSRGVSFYSTSKKGMWWPKAPFYYALTTMIYKRVFAN
jgi:hypothetical protein